MNVATKFGITTLVIAIIAFLAAPNGPIGQGLWPEPSDPMDPTGAQLPLFMLRGVFEAVAFGFGVAYWAFGMPISRRMFGSGPLGTAAHVSLGFVPGNFWVHDGWHMVNGLELGGLLAIEYLFHNPLMAAGAIMVAAGLRSGSPTEAARPADAPA